MALTKHMAFKILEYHAKRSWSRHMDSVTRDRITLGNLTACLEGMKHG